MQAQVSSYSTLNFAPADDASSQVTSSSEYDVCNDEFSSRGDDSDQDLDISFQS